MAARLCTLLPLIGLGVIASVTAQTPAQRELMLQTVETSERAQKAYCMGRAEPAIRELQRFIELAKRERVDVHPNEPYVESAFRYEMLLRNGQIAKLYRSLGKPSESAKYAAIAKEYSNGSMRKPFTSTEEVFEFVSSVDVNYCADFRGTK